ncbi:MAG: hypothetical protein LBP55_00375 [Candidatus Adiutrix sp.]|jgi:hypothetical protein|nr:hypothetical protein [Candidatus Adiutrix sp.]
MLIIKKLYGLLASRARGRLGPWVLSLSVLASFLISSGCSGPIWPFSLFSDDSPEPVAAASAGAGPAVIVSPAAASIINDPIASVVSTTPPGLPVAVGNSLFGPGTVTMEEQYTSALGASCYRALFVGQDGQRFVLAVCTEKDGSWITARDIFNPSTPLR